MKTFCAHGCLCLFFLNIPNSAHACGGGASTETSLEKCVELNTNKIGEETANATPSPAQGITTEGRLESLTSEEQNQINALILQQVSDPTQRLNITNALRSGVYSDLSGPETAYASSILEQSIPDSARLNAFTFWIGATRANNNRDLFSQQRMNAEFNSLLGSRPSASGGPGISGHVPSQVEVPRPSTGGDFTPFPNRPSAPSVGPGEVERLESQLEILRGRFSETNRVRRIASSLYRFNEATALGNQSRILLNEMNSLRLQLLAARRRR